MTGDLVAANSFQPVMDTVKLLSQGSDNWSGYRAASVLKSNVVDQPQYYEVPFDRYG